MLLEIAHQGLWKVLETKVRSRHIRIAETENCEQIVPVTHTTERVLCAIAFVQVEVQVTHGRSTLVLSRLPNVLLS